MPNGLCQLGRVILKDVPLAFDLDSARERSHSSLSLAWTKLAVGLRATEVIR